jgi:hypothetical protein
MFGCCKTFGRPCHPVLRLLFKVLIMLVILCAGGVSGFLYGIDFSFREMRHHAEHMDELPNNAIPRMAKDLSLTPDQLPEFERIFRKYHVDIARVEGENAVKVHELFFEMGKEILPLLNTAQATEFRELHRKICTVFLPPIPQYLIVESKAPHHPCEDL